MSSYKILLDIEEENANNNETKKENSNLEVKSELFIVESSSEVKKIKWMSLSKRSSLKKVKKAIYVTCFVGFIVFFVLLYWFVIGRKPPKCVPEPLLLRPKWNLTVTGIDISTRISLAPQNTKERHIAFGYFSTHKTHTTGVVMLNGTSGSVLWKQNLFSTPSEIDCQSFDANKDKVKDCLAVGPNGLLTCLNSATGKAIWYVHSHQDHQIPTLSSLPLVTYSDFTEDDVPELLSLVTTTGKQRYLMFISGISGIILGDFLPFPTWCREVTSPMKIVRDSPKSFLVISCVTNSTGEIWMASVEELYKAARKPSLQIVHAPLFHNVFQCYKPATQISLFADKEEPIIAAACNNGEVVVVDVLNKIITWRTILPYFTHSKVMGAEPPVMNNRLITMWSEANGTQSMIVVFSMVDGKIEWKHSPPTGVSISFVLPFYSRKYLRKFELLIKTTRCRNMLLTKSSAACHCIESFEIFHPFKRSTKVIMELNRFLNKTRKCKIPVKRSITSAVVGDLLGDGSQHAVIVKRCAPKTSHHSENHQFDDMTLKMVRIKSSDNC